MSRKLFGTDGIRGRANIYPMTGEIAFALGRAATSYFQNKTKSKTIGAAKILSRHKKSTFNCMGQPSHPNISILSQPSLAKHAGKEVGPGSDKQSDDELNEYIRSNAETAYHPCGTCKMGVDEMAVVDENLKVKGIQNLRIVDASVMPEIPSANLNAPTLMIAEKASDLILNNLQILIFKNVFNICKPNITPQQTQNQDS